MGYFIAGEVASLYSGKSRNARSDWPRVNGTITNSKVAINGRDEPPNWSFNFFFVIMRPHWDITVVFTYAVNGAQYTAEQRWYTSVNDETEARKEQLNYLTGETVIVNHDPQNPARAVIEPAKPTMKESNVNLIARVVGSILAMVGVLILAWRLLEWQP